MRLYSIRSADIDDVHIKRTGGGHTDIDGSRVATDAFLPAHILLGTEGRAEEEGGCCDSRDQADDVALPTGNPGVWTFLHM